MRLTNDQKRESIIHMRLAGIRFQRDITDSNDGQLVARNVLRFLELLPPMDCKGRIAMRRIERECETILERCHGA